MSIKDQVREIVAAVLGVRAAIVTDNTTVRDLGGNSIDAVRIIDAVEREMCVELSSETLAGVSTFGALALVAEAVKQASPSLERVKGVAV